jgi:hypothetical protein
MARRFVNNGNYSFTPSTSTIKVTGFVPIEKFLMITHINSGVVIQQFASPELRITTHSYSPTSTDLDTDSGVTTIVLNYDTTSLNASDKLQIIIEETDIRSKPFDFGVDAIERARVSNPNSLIDADFEYGTQGTKWHTFTSVNQLPGIYEIPGSEITVSNVATNNTSPYSTITVTANGHGLVVNSTYQDAVSIFGLQNSPPTASRAEGTFLVNSVTNANVFTYLAKGYVGPNTTVDIVTPYTQARKAAFYTGASLAVTNAVSDGANPSIITVNTANAHGLFPGHTLAVTTSGANNHDYAKGNFFVKSVESANQFTYEALTGAVVGAGMSNTNMVVYSRPDGFNIHRPFDGGVLIGPNSPAHGANVLRQSKQYFRYQSGKGILWTSGTLYQPNYDIESVTASGNAIGAAITVTTEQAHGIQAGSTVILSGIDTGGFNGSYTVASIVSENSLTVTSTAELEFVGANTADLQRRPRLAVSAWRGSSIRAGLFDEQNGLFWESDGQRVSVVKRSSTFQIAGTVAVSNGSHEIVGTGTRFVSQVHVGDNIIIRGQSKKVVSIANNTYMVVNPMITIGGSASVSGIKLALTIDERVPQEDFNRDRIDGTGGSGYNFDFNKMQMTGIDYSWYGAGFADFIIRGLNGDFVTVHRFKNNNINDEAYMRSGNLPARYEIVNEASKSYLTVAANTTNDFLTLANTYFFPSSGTLYVDNELVSYTGKTNANNTLTGVSRAASLSQFTGGETKTFTAGAAAAHAVDAGVTIADVTCSPTLSHWGSSVIMDGGFDLDRGYFFNYGEENKAVGGNSTGTGFLIRLAPSVSNGLAGSLGQRELINRALILLQKVEIITNRDTIVQGILNPTGVTGITWSNINSSSFGSQPSFVQISNSFTGTAAPGEQIFSTIASRAGGITTFDLSELKALGNGVVGGDLQYPDGPDVLAINFVNTDAQSANIQVNLFWTETQA